MITIAELDFENAHSPEDIINVGIAPLVKLAEILDDMEEISGNDAQYVWAINYAIRAGLEDVEASLYKLDKVFRAKSETKAA